MDVKRIERAADKLIDAFADMRITDDEMMYVAMYCVIKARPSKIIERMVDFGEQLKWEINNDRKNDKYVQDNLFD